MKDAICLGRRQGAAGWLARAGVALLSLSNTVPRQPKQAAASGPAPGYSPIGMRFSTGSEVKAGDRIA